MKISSRKSQKTPSEISEDLRQERICKELDEQRKNVGNEILKIGDAYAQIRKEDDESGVSRQSLLNPLAHKYYAPEHYDSPETANILRRNKESELMAKDQLTRAIVRVRQEEQTDQVASTSALPTEPVMFDPQRNKDELEAEYHERMRIRKAEDQERLRQHLIRLNAEEAEKKELVRTLRL